MSTLLKVNRREQKIVRDTARVICRPHIPAGNPEKVHNIFQRILRLSQKQAERLLKRVMHDYSKRHKNIEGIFERHFQEVKAYLTLKESISLSYEQKMLIGAYATMEYSIEAAALFNPSIVLHPNQDDVPEDSLRFVMSLRAVGEGHISSIVFRSGIIDSDGTIKFDSFSHYVDTPDLQLNPIYDRHLFRLKLIEMGASNEITDCVLDQLPQEFSYEQLKERISTLNDQPRFDPEQQMKCFNTMQWLANSNYRLNFENDHPLSERVIFPVSEEESGGIEDARFVKFQENGESTYYATYTAYNGRNIIPQMIVTKDFLNFRISTLNGKAVQNKGMALFPRKIKGRYAMLSRQDGENNHVMFSDHYHFWQKSQIIQEPCEPWEFIQIGNCGSPMETKEGWLVLTHGVGPMREYSIGAILLDLDDPTKLIGRLKSPLIRPHEDEREGYVPNVVYTCGAMIHKGQLIIPYSMSDMQAGITHIDVDEVIDAMHRP